jgi:hypothetical protein
MMLEKKYRHVLTILISVLMVSPLSLLVVSDNVQATTSYWMCNAPSSFNSTFWTIPSDDDPTTAYGAQVGGDPYTQDLIGSEDEVKAVKTNDFTNPTWNGPFLYEGFPGGYDDYTGDLPPDNATIMTVFMFAFFNSNRPMSKLSFSTNDEGTYTTSSTYAAGTGLLLWNITSLRTWTPSLLNSTDLWARLYAYPATGVHYYLDYLGFLITFSMTYGGSGSGPPEGPSEGDTGWNYNILEGNGIIGIMGIIGFCGMIALPAFAIWQYKNGNDDGAIVTFIKLLVAGMFCLTMFLYSMSV